MISGDKVNLRPITKDDLTVLNLWKNDEETFRNLGGGYMPTSIDQQAKWMDSIIDTSGENKRFVICDKQNVPVGIVGLYRINFIHRNCEIGVYLGNKESKGKGYGIEACRLIERFAKEYLNLRKIKIKVVSDNEVAIHMYMKLGYTKVGEYMSERFIKGKYKNLTIMEKMLSEG